MVKSGILKWHIGCADLKRASLLMSLVIQGWYKLWLGIRYISSGKEARLYLCLLLTIEQGNYGIPQADNGFVFFHEKTFNFSMKTKDLREA